MFMLGHKAAKKPKHLPLVKKQNKTKKLRLSNENNSVCDLHAACLDSRIPRVRRIMANPIGSLLETVCWWVFRWWRFFLINVNNVLLCPSSLTSSSSSSSSICIRLAMGDRCESTCRIHLCSLPSNSDLSVCREAAAATTTTAPPVVTVESDPSGKKVKHQRDETNAICDRRCMRRVCLDQCDRKKGREKTKCQNTCNSLYG